jgi:hypothetical protein
MWWPRSRFSSCRIRWARTRTNSIPLAVRRDSISQAGGRARTPSARLWHLDARLGSQCGPLAAGTTGSTNLQVVIDADIRLVVAMGLPPGSRNDCRAFTESGFDRACRSAPTIGDGVTKAPACSSRTAKGEVKPISAPAQSATGRGEHCSRRARACVEHTLSRLKSWTVSRHCRLKDSCVHQTTLGITQNDWRLLAAVIILSKQSGRESVGCRRGVHLPLFCSLNLYSAA